MSFQHMLSVLLLSRTNYSIGTQYEYAYIAWVFYSKSNLTNGKLYVISSSIFPG